MAKHNALTTLGRSGNPMFRGTAFTPDTSLGQAAAAERMTLAGTVNKTGILLVLCLVTASYTWSMFFESGDWASVSGLFWLGLIGGLVLALITIFKRQWAGITAPLYALAEGLALGGISAMFEMKYPGIVIQAIGLTFGTLGVLLLAYKSGWIKPTQNFRLMIVAATGGIFILYLVSFIMGFFGSSIGFIHSNGLFGIGFSLFVVAIAALNLVLDFDFIEEAAEQGAPKYLEWYGAFSLMVTLVWLYLEILRLLAKLHSRN
ncbi:MAG: Bax inhibitor-1/YccA family protein [Arenicellales bacterium]|nr:Bax inhibitor-1/YccA family protein [Arenicellales bacterium]MDP6855413.1 Bax inhibitor-1/YccA family protein [Arenicellales bacterium]MDP6949205.1 Bax inhibitor-1/YccA family protein [Arenicellales bacterium]